MLLSPALLACLLLPAQPGEDKVHSINQRSFRVPVQVDPGRREEIRLLELHVSRDLGKTWEVCALIDPARDSFLYKAPVDGVYWFAVRLALKNEKYEPEEIAELQPALKVSVSEKPVVAPPPPLPTETPRTAPNELEEEVKQMRAEMRRLKERVATLERLLKDRP